MKFESFPERPNEVPDEKVEEKKEDKKTDGISRREFLEKAGKGLIGGAIVGSGLGKGIEALASPEEKEEEGDFKQVLEDWQEYKRVVKESKVKENMQFIEEAYGPTTTKVTGRIKRDLFLFNQLVEREQKGEDLAATPQGRNLLTKGAIEDFRLFWDQREFDRLNREAEKKNGLTGEVKYFDKVEGMTNEKLCEIIESKFNRRWLYGNISSFEYIDEDKTAKCFGVAGQAINDDLNGIFYKSGREKVVIYHNEAIKNNTEQLLEIISHEIAHHQDWSTNNRLPIQERLQFLREVTERFNSPDRFHSPYVEVDIPDEYSDYSPQEIKYFQAKEYWAVLVERYDMYNEALKKYQPQDYELVEKWRKKIIKEP